MQTFKERNYKKEYENYHSKPDQKKRRAGRNKARRDVVKSVKDSKQLVGKDVHHKDNNPMNNPDVNLSVGTQKYNRTEPRKREEERDLKTKILQIEKELNQQSISKVLIYLLSPRDAHFKNKTIKIYQVKKSTRCMVYTKVLQYGEVSCIP